MTTTEPAAAVTTDPPPDLFHWVCCDHNTALCGQDVTGLDWTPAREPVCAVCAALYGQPCGHCGWTP